MNLPRQLRRSSKKGSIRVLCFRSQERSMLWEGWHGFRYWILPRGPESWSLRNVHRWIIKCLKSALFLFLPSVALECELLLPLKVWEMGCHLLFTRCTYSRKKRMWVPFGHCSLSTKKSLRHPVPRLSLLVTGSLTDSIWELQKDLSSLAHLWRVVIHLITLYGALHCLCLLSSVLIIGYFREDNSTWDRRQTWT